MSNTKDIVRERAHYIAHSSKEAVVSETYLYPLLGVFYLAQRRSLWPPIASRVVPCLGLSAAVIVPMFLITYIPQAAVLTFIDGPLGPLSAVMLVLSESSVIINALARAFLLQHTLYDIFDATLICEGQDAFVARGREVKAGRRSDGAKKLGKLIKKPFTRFSPSSIVQYLVMLPLNLVPVVGTAVFLILQGRRMAPSFHTRYFQLKGFDKSQRDSFIHQNKGAYVGFGTAAVFMNLVPFASIFFTFTSTVGAALWASDLERNAQHPGETIDISGRESMDELHEKEL